MRCAIFSDVHNHTAALEAMLRHAQQQGVEAYFCLGDVGIDDCVALVRDLDALAVFGNWEVTGWPHLSPENQQWALGLPPVRQYKNFWLSHATPFWPSNLASLADLHRRRREVSLPQLFPYLHFESETLWQIIGGLAEANMPVLFHGHTHRQIAWRFTADNHLQKLTHHPIILRSGDTLVVGVGSVGRPEDGPGAAYVIYDDAAGRVEFMRVMGRD